MLRTTLILLSAAAVMSCSPRPSYEDVISTFRDNKATFTMIASKACDIAKEEGKAKYEVSRAKEKETALLDMAQSVSVNAIHVEHKEERCYLSMPVWETQKDNVESQFAYRYNVTSPSPYLQQQHDYQNVVQAVEQKKPNNLQFDMQLSSKWFFTVSARHQSE
ncbi:hypothetical protein OCL06_02230 [Alteromonas sp. ASW11-19]|uniref:Lipoprotein n=1 Tax=Alteromonas salexigens TaxID=2982530 RepID=A0ABT2VKV1_9ALTE|nr:hypothetical protein [Alteromonas salexigens]MCU7553412.1 hypothetical protein [Alteromonas salexigens]